MTPRALANELKDGGLWIVVGTIICYAALIGIALL